MHGLIVRDQAEHFTVITADPKFLCQSLCYLQPSGAMLSGQCDYNLLHTLPPK